RLLAHGVVDERLVKAHPEAVVKLAVRGAHDVGGVRAEGEEQKDKKLTMASKAHLRAPSAAAVRRAAVSRTRPRCFSSHTRSREHHCRCRTRSAPPRSATPRTNPARCRAAVLRRSVRASQLLTYEMRGRSVEELQRGTVQDWFEESHYAAARYAYDIGNGVLGSEYAKKNIGVVYERLLRGGLRLRKVLEDALSTP